MLRALFKSIAFGFLVLFTLLVGVGVVVQISLAISSWQEVDVNNDGQINFADIRAAMPFFGCPDHTDCGNGGGNGGEMVFPGADWQAATPENQGINSAQLEQAVQYLESQCDENGVDELMIIRNGYVVYQGSNTERVHLVWSVTKAFTSTTMGLLYDDGLFSPNDYAYQWVPDLQAQYSQATLDHFATFTSGYDAEGGHPSSGDQSNTPWIPTAPMFAPGTNFTYWEDAANMLGHILTQMAGKSMENLFTTRIADPIGMNPSQWYWKDFGVVDGLVLNGGGGTVDAGMHISARQVARLGHLYLNNGNWNGAQLLSTYWIDQATQNHVSANLPPPIMFEHADGRGIYGYHWWVNGIKPDGTRNLPDAPLNTYYRTGYMHNMLFVIPDWQMVIVRLGTDTNPDDRIGVWNNFLSMVGGAIFE